ncbi:MAG TPA: GNAT family N-acetyltransferase [Steroidobacteraceae bacterium]|nr:GNAT family N-acetyltransferase [Steroidobacteraceae bacterium]HNS27548.1 GNAT family N-acetyltransferase [Steroidobacteraceae bacterium]
MSVTVRDARVLASDRRWIEGVYRDYLDDLAPLNTGIFPALGEIGHREPDQLARWFADPGAKILTVCKSAAPVGFAMVVPGRRLPGRPPVDFHMAEFFIAREHRRLGIGQSAIALIFDRFAGRWEVQEYLRNPVAVKFWRRVVGDYTRGDYEERVEGGEVRQTFRSGPARAPS